MGKLVAVVNKRGENSTETAVTMLKMLKHKKAEAFGLASPRIVKIEKSVETLQKQDVNSPIVIGHVFSKTPTHNETQPIKTDENATLVFEGRIYSTSKEYYDTETVAKKFQKNHEDAIKDLVKKTKDDFALVMAELGKIIASRDTLGMRPLYYGENMEFAALASERKALWKIGIALANSFPPGYVAHVDRNGFKFKPIKTLAFSAVKQMPLKTAARRLQELLQQSTGERVLGLTEVAVAFSGGLDSSVIAVLAKKFGVDVHLIHVSLRNQQETEYAKKAAEELKLPIYVYTCSEEDVINILPQILWLIEESDPVKISIGIPLFWAAERASKMNLEIMLAGHGADELFGGYKRYVDVYALYGEERVHRVICDDVARLHETNFERDFKICNFHDVELRLPFATHKIVKFATELPPKLKIEMKKDGLRKLVLRQMAQNLGLPKSIIEKPKKAIQYTTGINNALKKLARKERLPIREYLHKIFQKTFKGAMQVE